MLGTPSDDRLEDCLERAVARTLGPMTVFSGMSWKRCEYSSSYETYVATLSRPGGGDLKVFIKDYGSCRQIKAGMEARRERERHVYSSLLVDPGLDTARYYGSDWDHALGRYWILLEFVDGAQLAHSVFEHWVAGAAWLGRLQGYFAQCAVGLRPDGHLLEHDDRFFMSTAERACAAVQEMCPPLSGSLARIVEHYDRVVDLMVSQPRTLVHGAFCPGQILVDSSRRPPRICPVDWELAAIGSSLYDLAFLADGFKPPRLDQVLDAYRQEAVRYDVPVPSPDDMKHLVNCFRLHKVFNWLSVARERQYSEGDIAKLTGMAKQVADSVL